MVLICWFLGADIIIIRRITRVVMWSIGDGGVLEYDAGRQCLKGHSFLATVDNVVESAWSIMVQFDFTWFNFEWRAPRSSRQNSSESGKSKRPYLRHATLVSGSRKVGSKKVRPPHGTRSQAKDSLSGTPLLYLFPHFPQSTLKLLFSSQIHDGSSQGTAIELSGGLIACVARWRGPTFVHFQTWKCYCCSETFA
jgi:hypothetical protein